MSGYGDIIASFFTEMLPHMGGDVYNEFSLQFELGVHLRKALEENGAHSKVLFEKNINALWPGSGHRGFVKKEIDLLVKSKGSLDCAIELKYPRNGRYPDEMFDFITDIRFLEQLKDSGVREVYAVTLVDDPAFNDRDGRSRRKDGIYAPFRTGSVLEGTIPYPTANDDRTISLDGCYTIDWQETGDGRWYYVVGV